MQQHIERARKLLGWPTQRKLLELAEKYPEPAGWQYAVAMLAEADHPNEAYLVACLETAAQLRAARERRYGGERYGHGPYPNGLGQRGCPWYPGLYCPWAPSCEGWEKCSRPQPWFLKLLREKNQGRVR